MFHLFLLPLLHSTDGVFSLVRRLQFLTNPMRRFPALPIVLAAFGWNAAMAQNPFEPDFNIACVERIPLPAYPILARQMLVEGTISASVVLSPQASVQLITTEFASKTPKVTGSLIQTVEDAIRGAVFRVACGGKTVSLVFDFKISGVAADNPKQSVAYGYPNKFWVVTEPGKPMATGRPAPPRAELRPGALESAAGAASCGRCTQP